MSLTDQKIVVKIGTNVLTNENGDLDVAVIRSVVNQIVEIKRKGHKVILVSSGAVGAGKAAFQLKNVKNETTKRQVYSAVGQVKLMSLYSELFEQHGMYCAQVLASKEDFLGGTYYKNMKNCFRGLLLDDIIPIVNENDVVSVKELMFTDNDELAGLTAYLIEANTLVILSNIDGFYDGDPEAASSKVIPIVRLSKNTEQFVQSSKSSQGRGGMESKFETAKRCTERGIETYLANGKHENILLNILKNDFIGTKFTE